MHRRFSVCAFGAFLAAAFSVSSVMGQANNAGVIVDAAGVVSVKVVRDPGGRLHRARMAEAKAGLDPDLARPSELRKISLNRLESALAERIAKGEKPTEEMNFLAGLTRVTHVFYYPETQDIVIAGPAEGFGIDTVGRAVGVVSGQSIVELQDLVAALRAFPPSGKKTSLIGVSIDPTAEGLTNLQKTLAGIGGIIGRNDGPRVAAALKESLGLQNVTIQGISPKTHFAQVLTEADYRMKLIGIGLETPGVRMTSYVDRAKPREVAANAMQRWYFTPNYEKLRVSEDGNAVEFVGAGVQLVGADELVREDGTRVGSGKADLASKAFTKDFTDKYPELARATPVYGQLRNLIDLAVAAAYIQDRDFYSQADWKMTAFGDESKYAIETYTAPTKVGSAVNAIWRGGTLMTPIGGGVNLQPLKALDRGNLIADTEKTAADARSQQQSGLKSLAAGQWWWD
ncbi:MAG: DUF1598 domain-containing protein [bacterium]|nr:DUF1598 domain-containing protein [bacterium]